MRFRVIAIVVITLVSLPAFAQIDPSGEWAPRFHEDNPERLAGPEIGDYLGLPINDAARLRGDSWDASLLTLPEHQCKPHPADYGPRGPANLRFWKEVDKESQQTIAFHTHISWQAPERTIWMDGRAHPPEYAAHTWQGFSTGKWEGDTLTVTTTHLKTGWIRRNGIPRSDRATLTEHWIRHGDYLTLVSIITDPVYLTEPFIRTTNWIMDPRQQIAPYPCESVVEVDRPKGSIPHHLPGTNTYLSEFPKRFNLPEVAARGGAETMYPEFQKEDTGGEMIRRGFLLVLTMVLAHAAGYSQQSPNPQINVLHVQGNVYMLVGAVGNIAVQVGSDGILMVDTGSAPMTEQVIATVKQLAKPITSKPLRFIINTHFHPDHTGGNEKARAAGTTITGGNVAGNIQDASEGAAIFAHENVMKRMSAPSGAQPPTPSGGWPTDTYFGDTQELFFDGEAIQMFHPKSAHTDGDSIVFFRRSDVVSTGDIFLTTNYPIIDLQSGGSINGTIDALNFIIDLTIPAEKQEGGTMVIPGHGRLCDEADVVEYRDMVTIIRDRIQDMIKKGMTLEQVKTAKPTRDYDPLYGSTTGFWTTDMFVEAVYKSLSTKK